MRAMGIASDQELVQLVGSEPEIVSNPRFIYLFLFISFLLAITLTSSNTDFINASGALVLAVTGGGFPARCGHHPAGSAFYWLSHPCTQAHVLSHQVERGSMDSFVYRD
jgi:hypothetical protein